jgi:serine/threonine protein kinase
MKAVSRVLPSNSGSNYMITKENIFVSNSGTLRIGDFGLSRMMSEEAVWLTNASQAAGTVRWMAPELLNGDAPRVTKESDIYAFGMTVLVCGVAS